MTDGAAPNITGDLPSEYASNTYTATGVFDKTTTSRKVYAYTTNTNSYAVDFDASRSSSVYGANNTTKIVTSGTAVYICIRY